MLLMRSQTLTLTITDDRNIRISQGVILTSLTILEVISKASLSVLNGYF
jgi:hypothetical protein